MSLERLNRYFGEVFNRLDTEHVDGLQEYLMRCCSLDGPFHSLVSRIQTASIVLTSRHLWVFRV